MYELAVQRSEAIIVFSCRFRHGSNPSVKMVDTSDYTVEYKVYIQCVQKVAFRTIRSIQF